MDYRDLYHLKAGQDLDLMLSISQGRSRKNRDNEEERDIRKMRKQSQQESGDKIQEKLDTKKQVAK